MFCTFCKLERDCVANGPGVSICSPCATRFRGEPKAAASGDFCSFCGERNRRIAGTSVTGDARICSDCVTIAIPVLEHNRSVLGGTSNENDPGGDDTHPSRDQRGSG